MAKGDSIQNAIKVNSIREEKEYLSKRYKKYKLIRQTLYANIDVERRYDKLEIELPDGTIKEIFFDITSFFGKGF